MTKLDFSSRAEPAAAPTSAALDFSGSADPLDSLQAAFRAQHGADVPLPPDLTLPARPSGRSAHDVLVNQSIGTGDALAGSLVRTSNVLPFIAAGLSDLIGDHANAERNFRVFDQGKAQADQLDRNAVLASKPAAVVGSVLGIVPKVAAPATLALDPAAHGSDLASSVLQQNGDLSTAYELGGVGTAASTAQLAMPLSAPGNLLVRMLTGGALNAGTATGEQAIEHRIAPSVVSAPTGSDALTSGGIGAILAAALGHGAATHVPTEALTADPEFPALAAPKAPEGLPRGADFSARAEPVRPAAPDVGGAVHVDSQGAAATPEQAMRAFTDALGAASQQAPAPGLPEPVLQVDRAGNAMTTADLHAKAQPREPVEDLAAALGLTPDVLRAQARDPRMARELPPSPPRALPAPTVTVDKAGTAMTSSDYLRAVQAKQAAAEERQTLGITPDIERTQGTRWAKQARHQQAEADRLAHIREMDTAIAEREKQNMPARGRNALPNEGVDDALTFLAKKGGLDRREFIKQGVDPAVASSTENRTRGGASRPLFRARDGGGMSLDQVAETLQQHGYLPEADNAAALDLIMQGVNQDTPAYSIHREPQEDLLALHQARQDAANHVTPDYADVPFSFAGERARTADRGALEQAQQMEAMGRDSVPDRYGNQPGSPEDTHMATGWHRGADGKWRFEIDDSTASVNAKALRAKDPTYYRPMLEELERAHGRSLRDGAIDEARRMEQSMREIRAASNLPLKLGDVLQHQALLDAYPHVADIPISIDPDMSSWGAFHPGTGAITIRSPGDYPASGDRSLKSVLLHEVQHAIQTTEGFARGGSTTEFARPRMAERDQLEAQIQTLNKGMSKASAEGDKPTYDRLMRERRDVVRQLHEKGLASDIDIQDRSHRDYHRLAGEVEARNTQIRLGMSAEERRATPPTETADVPRTQQIVRVNSEPGERRAISHDDAQAIAKYNAKLSEYLGKTIRFTPASHVPDVTRRALAAFDAAFGSRSIVVHNDTPAALDFNGVTLRDGVRMLNEDATAPLLTVAGHELIHQLRKDAPDLYAELHEEVRRQGHLASYGEVLRQRAIDSGDENPLHPEAIAEDLIADATGDAVTDPAFMEDLARRNPRLFRRLADHMMRFLASVSRKLRSLGSSPFLDDVDAFRAKLADVLERYAERKTGSTATQEDMPPGPMFSRKPAGDEFANLEDVPARRPGESQADYARRVVRKNGDEIREGLALAKQQRDIGRLGMRAMWAKQDRAIAIADHAFAQYRKLFDKEDPAVNLRTIDQWENGQPIGDYDARQFFGLMKEAFDQRTAKIQALAPEAMQQLIDHYFPHIWEDSSRALKWYQGLSAKRPLQGDRSFLKQRVHATIKDGMATGLKPVSTNPVDLAILKLGQMDKFIAFHEFRQDLERRGWLRKMEAGERVPVGYARVEDPAFQIAGGLQGYFAVPELIARDINNYLSPSLYRFGAWKALRTVQNVLMSSRLGLSMFHGGFTTMDNLVMHADVAGRRLMQGDLAGGISTLLKAPLSIVWSPFEGGRLNKEWLGVKPSDPHTAAVLDMLEQGGAHMKMSATEYNNALPKLIRAVRQKSASGTLKQTLPAISEAISWVIHHKLVPAQKMGARVMLAKFELDRVAGSLGKARGDYRGIIDALHPDALKQLAAHVVDLVDDRLGQMNYDNQFWNKTAREAAQAAIGAVGWQVGTLRTVTGGVRDLVHLWKPEKLLSTLDKAGNLDGDLGRVSGRLTYLVTLALLMGGLSAITQYLLTGEGPSELKDYFFPKTGNRNDDGSDERLQWPSYWSDHYKLATHPLQTAMHKVHPSIGMLMEALANQDYYGTEIRNPDASWGTQAGQVGEYLAKGFVPYSLTGADELKGASTGRQVANFFGLTKAPASVSRSPFQAFVAEKAYDAMPQGARSQQQAEHSKAMHDAEAAVRRGEEPSMEGLTPEDRRNVDKAARLEVPAIRFRRLSIEDKLRAYDLATPAERARYQLAPMILRSNWHKAVRDLPEGEQEAVLAKIQALIP